MLTAAISTSVVVSGTNPINVPACVSFVISSNSKTDACDLKNTLLVFNPDELTAVSAGMIELPGASNPPTDVLRNV